MKACFIGVGSIAKRHIKNLKEVCEAEKIFLQIDVCRRFTSKKNEEIEKYVANIYYDINELPKDYDVIFITNPTEYHLETLCKVHMRAKHFFIEKPLTSYKKMDKVLDIKLKDDSIYYIACPLRYNSVIQYIKREVNPNNIVAVRSICSSYLPEWREGVDYRETYSADKDLGGGVCIDLIHEWDYLKYLFGLPQKVVYIQSKKSNLEINCEDYAGYIAEYDDKIVELHLDYFGRKSIREIMIFTEEDTIVGDIINGKVTYLKSGKIVEFSSNRDEYQKREIMHFLEMINGKIQNDNDIKDAYQTLKLTKGII